MRAFCSSESGSPISRRTSPSSSDRDLGEHYDVAGFILKVDHFHPDWVAFHGKAAARVVSRARGHGRDVTLGQQPWRVAQARVFVVPSASGANRDRSRLEGRNSRVEWFMELHSLLQGE